MNIKRLKAVRDAIAGETIPGLTFNMKDFVVPIYNEGERCGTAACIAGWAVHLATGQNKPLYGLSEMFDAIEEGKPFIISDFAGKWLGLTDAQAFHLFFAPDKQLSSITKADAIATIDNLIATGKVEWSAGVMENV